MPQPADRPADPAPAVLQVAVERTGGFAGIARHWSVTAPPERAQWWRELVDACPWPEASASVAAPPPGADRFCWTVTAVAGDDQRTAELAEHEVIGPWRTLIDVVRDESPAPSTPEQ